jgi:exodeoxyribonuclease V alpha subunit
VLPLVDAHFPMLQRNLLYTGMTRAKKLLVVVASPKALEMAVRVGPDSPRFVRQTSLAARVKALVGG